MSESTAINPADIVRHFDADGVPGFVIWHYGSAAGYVKLPNDMNKQLAVALYHAAYAYTPAHDYYDPPSLFTDEDGEIFLLGEIWNAVIDMGPGVWAEAEAGAIEMEAWASERKAWQAEGGPS